MQKEIGSNFDFNPEILIDKERGLHMGEYGITGNDEALFSTGRGAEGFVLDAIQERNPKIRKTALVPPFTCEVVLEPFMARGYEISAYPVEGTLDVDMERFRSTLLASGAQIVLVHRYFGFDTLKGFGEVAEEFQSRGVVFIEDRTQCLYSSFPDLHTDYTLGSMRKWAALPDGGFAVCRDGVFSGKPREHDVELERKKMEASCLKYRYLHENCGEKEEYLRKFKAAEEVLDAEERYFRMSPSGIGVQCSLDIEELKRRRRSNYSRLYESICNQGFERILTPRLGEHDVPLYLAILAKNRNEIQAKLREHNIYAPVVWPKPDFMPPVCSEAQEIFDKVLCLPIDQRYEEDDMARLAKTLEREGNHVSG
ncbi:MAG: hypothetical protein HFG83_08400 [Dorea sp.]|jgi:hypothetical protein|nr:hypothetical protein [Dorea sp.]MCI9453833.1 hypothetical protein [Dorea sp.]